MSKAIDLAMHDIADASGIPHIARPDGHRSSIIEEMQATRRRPRSIRVRDLIPAHIRERYEERWQLEDRALLAAEIERQAETRRGWFARLFGR